MLDNIRNLIRHGRQAASTAATPSEAGSHSFKHTSKPKEKKSTNFSKVVDIPGVDDESTTTNSTKNSIDNSIETSTSVSTDSTNHKQRREHHADELKPFAEDIVKQENLDEINRRNQSRKSIERYKIGEKLGEGAFSIVYAALDSVNNQKVAIKVIKKYQLDEKQRNNVLKEVNLMRQLHHPNIVSLIDFIENDQYYYIIQELVSGGEIFNEIVKYTYFSEDLSRHVIIQVAEALLYMHEQVGIVHRDLKPENIFFKPIKYIKDDPKSRFQKLRKSDNPQAKVDEGKFIMNYGGGGIGIIKIGDFGLSKQINLHDNNALKTPCGTIGYTAPEIVRDMRYSKEVDMWALGCVLYILLCGFPPFYNDSIDELTRTVAKGEFKFLSPWWDEISSGAKNCVARLLTVNPLHRYTVEQFLRDPWILEFLNRSENIQTQEKMKQQQQQQQQSQQEHRDQLSNTIPQPSQQFESPASTANQEINRVPSGMPGLEPLKPYQSYSQSLASIDCMDLDDEYLSPTTTNTDNTSKLSSNDETLRSLNDDDDTKMDCETSFENSGAVNSHHLEPGFGAESSRENTHAMNPESLSDKRSVAGPTSGEFKDSIAKNYNNTNRRKRKIDKNVLFTPEIRAMKDMFDISVAAHRMHEESRFTPGPKIGHHLDILEEDEDNDGKVIGGTNHNRMVNLDKINVLGGGKDHGTNFHLNMNDASILARRQKKKGVLVTS